MLHPFGGIEVLLMRGSSSASVADSHDREIEKERP